MGAPRTKPRRDVSDVPMDELLATLTPLQFKYIRARLVLKTDTEACRLVGIRPSTPGLWKNQSEVEEVIRRYLLDTVEVARKMLKASSANAVETLVKGLTSRQAVEAAKAILDRAGLPAASRHEVEVEPKPRPMKELTDEELMEIAARGVKDVEGDQNGQTTRSN